MYGALLPFLFLLASAGAVLRAAPPAAPYSVADLRLFQQRAEDRRLAQEPYWLVLLHTAPRTCGGAQSRIDAPAFFLAPDGTTNPEAELRSDLAAFFAAPVAGRPAAADRFPARLEWLCSQLGIDRARLPVSGCAELEQALAELQPRSASLVFPAAYMNTPGSMFGHTLIKIKGQAQSDLLARAISYAAHTTETNGFVFAFKGIFGFYPGLYSLTPYYQKVQEYNDIDQRDIWEYELSLTAPEMRRMLLHVWELRDTYADYYFFDENCSFSLLFLLDAARPGLNLSAGGRPWVIPLDTVRQIRAAGLIVNTTYRASRATRLRYMASRLAPASQEQARRIALGLDAPETVTRANPNATDAARVLDLAAEYLQGRRGRSKVTQAEFQPRFLGILQARSRLGVPDASQYEVPPPASPESGHGSSRLGLGLGREAGRSFAEIAYRPAYHALLDPPTGYVPGAQIDFMNIVLRASAADPRVSLQRLDLVSLRSLAPRDRFFQPLSWKADVASVRERTDDGEWQRLAHTGVGAGATWYGPADGLLYALAETDLELGGAAVGYAVGLGASAGLLQPLGRRGLLDLYGRALDYPLGDRHGDVEFGARVRWTLQANQAVSLEAARRFAWDYAETTLALRWHLFF